MADANEKSGIFGSILKGTRVLAPLGGSILGGVLSKDQREAAQQQIEQTTKLFQEAGLPPDTARQLALQQYQVGPLVDPILEEELNLGPSAVSEMQIPGVGRETQMEALEAYKQLASLGLSPTDRASLNKLRDQVASQTEGKRQQILQQMQQRGLAGSGQELAAQLASSQAGAEQASEESDRLASLAFEGRRAALNSLGAMGGQLRSSDFNEELKKKEAQDLFKRYAFENSSARQQRNVAQQNLAEAGNVARQQKIADRNVELTNVEAARQREAERQRYLDMMNRSATGKSIYGDLSKYYQDQAKQTQQNVSTIGKEIGTVAKTAEDLGIASKLYKLFGG